MGQQDPPEKEMETLSSIVAWEIPWTEEPSGLQSTGSKKSDMTEATEHTQYHGQDSLRTSPGVLGGSRAPEEQKC